MAGIKPDVGDVHVDALLTNVSIGYQNDDYVADKVLPLVGVNKQSDVIAKYDKSDWMRDEMAERAPGTEARSATYAVDNDTSYFCKSYALKREIPDEVRVNADAPYDMDRDAVLFLTQQAMIRRERAMATAMNATGIWTTNTTVGTKWSDFANSDPMNDIFTGNRTMQQLIGRAANTIVMGQIVYDRLRLHPDFMELVKYTTTNNVPDAAQMGNALGLKLYVVKAIYESATEGGTSSLAAIWDDDAVLLYVPNAPSLMNPGAGYTFFWKPLTGGGPQYIRKYRKEHITTDFVEVRSFFDMKILSADAGVRWADCVD
ncbi:MAG: major capsid protein [Candidatus Odinarchaeota archaeon]